MTSRPLLPKPLLSSSPKALAMRGLKGAKLFSIQVIIKTAEVALPILFETSLRQQYNNRTLNSKSKSEAVA